MMMMMKWRKNSRALH